MLNTDISVSLFLLMLLSECLFKEPSLLWSIQGRICLTSVAAHGPDGQELTRQPLPVQGCNVNTKAVYLYRENAALQFVDVVLS